ncbi:hypothetical protein GWG65_18560 [Bradyrhizobium sp. CSA207]|uniref:hypothetical protein n=1 Tax=Bradyrhizobium sp. CSA207 TaxID=2698826 RepID=UPI0023B11AA7|nr:hypothetical protein [Bradyrhizobium sp. CSA207]MDE5443410.1 hypothetical protein [Bradyrhizobium sp. CSA207]
MQTNMTLGDGILSVLLGVLGSLIAAYLFLYAPRWLSRASIVWAERSKRASLARIQILKSQLDQIDEFQKSPAAFLAWSIASISRAVLYGLLGMFLSIHNFAAKADYSLDVLLVKFNLRDPNFVWGMSDDRVIAVLYNGAIVASNILIAMSVYSFVRLGQFRNLDERRMDFEAEIERLTK